MKDRLRQVRALVSSGCSVLGTGRHTKRPSAPLPSWKHLQERIPTDDEIVEIAKQPGIALICGAVSGNVEVIDLEGDAPIDAIKAAVEARRPGMLTKLYQAETPGGGCHWAYRCEVIAGNQKLASSSSGKTWGETRGEGGYFLTTLSSADAHPSRKLYKRINGSLTELSQLTPEEREILHDIIRSFNEYIRPEKAKGFREASQGNGTRPGEDFNNHPDVLSQVQALLTDHGWSKFGNGRKGESWARPGVSDHSSATLYDSGFLYLFSSNAKPFDSNELYSPFAIYAELKHSGDFRAAAKALANQGYGKQLNGNGHHPPKITTPTVEPDAALRFVCMNDVQAKAVEWLWTLYIALGALTIGEGPPGVGKSTLACAIAAAITRGRGLPGMDEFLPGKVLLCSAEDSKAHVLRPRLDRAGADLTKIFALDEPLTLDLQGRLRLETAVIDYQPTFILLDPFFAYTGGKVDIHRANEMRDITAWLTKIAEKHNCAILAIRHLAKSRGYGQALNAGLGSIDLVAAARSVLLVGQDPDDGRKRALVQIKNNLGPIGPAVGFTLEDGMFYWTGESDMTASRILSVANQEERSAIDEAMAFLRESLADEDRETTDVIAEAKRAGISDKTLRNARERLNIRARRSGLPGTKQKFYWSLSDAQPSEPHDEREERVAIQEEGRPRYEPVFTDPERKRQWNSYREGTA